MVLLLHPGAYQQAWNGLIRRRKPVYLRDQIGAVCGFEFLELAKIESALRTAGHAGGRLALLA
jgi:hypothetical protein